MERMNARIQCVKLISTKKNMFASGGIIASPKIINIEQIALKNKPRLDKNPIVKIDLSLLTLKICATDDHAKITNAIVIPTS